MPQFYYEHYYLWGYAVFSAVALVVAVVGGVVVWRRRRSLGIALLLAGALAVIGGRSVADVGWLLLSQGSNMIDFLKHPDREPPMVAVDRIADIVHYFGVVSLALAIPMLARDLGAPRTGR